MARGLACERLNKPLNWAMYIEWTNVEQQWCMARVEQIDLLNFNEELDYGPYTPKQALGQVVKCSNISITFDYFFEISNY